MSSSYDIPSEVQFDPAQSASLKDSVGRYRTQSLFLETNDIEGKYPSLFTLKAYDHRGRLSLRRLYLEVADPTEYTFAIGIFGFWEHWQKLVGLGWFLEHLQEWRKELDIKLQSAAIKDIKKEAKKSGSSGLAASRWLAEKKYRLTKDSPKRGRPTKDEKAGYLASQEREKEAELEDAKRIGLLN